MLSIPLDSSVQPPVVLNTNALSAQSRLQRAADEFPDNFDLYNSASETNKDLVITLLGTHINHTLGPEMYESTSADLGASRTLTAANVSYVVPLSRYLGDRMLQLQFL